MSTERRYDIDWIRVIAIGLLIIYHISIVFLPWGALNGFIQSEKSLKSLWIPMSMLNVWRIPLLFFVSGMGVCFAMRKRNLIQLFFERIKRILIPFIFGVMIIVPIQNILQQKYYLKDIVYTPQPSHLWFLGNLFVYVIILSPVFSYLKKNENFKLNKWMQKQYSNPFMFVLILVPFVIEVFVIHPKAFEMYAMTLHGFILGLLAFFFGFTFILNGDVFWQTLLKWRWLYLLIAISAFIIRLLIFNLKAPNFIVAFESIMWILTILGFAYKYLNYPSKTLQYLKQSAYPIYILHIVFIYLSSLFILPLDLKSEFKFLLIILFTFLGSFFVYDLLIKRIKLLRPLFGI